MFLIFHRIKVSDKQLMLLIAERTKAKQGSTTISWADLAKKLNTEGPCIKSTLHWSWVNIAELFLRTINDKCNTFPLLVLFKSSI